MERSAQAVGKCQLNSLPFSLTFMGPTQKVCNVLCIRALESQEEDATGPPPLAGTFPLLSADPFAAPPIPQPSATPAFPADPFANASGGMGGFSGPSVPPAFPSDSFPMPTQWPVMSFHSCAHAVPRLHHLAGGWGVFFFQHIIWGLSGM